MQFCIIIDMTFKNEKIQRQKNSKYGYGNNQEEGVSSNEITNYLNDKNNTKTFSEKIRNINKQYENGEIDKKEKEIKTNKILKENTINLRTVQRSLNYLINEGVIIKKNNRYRLSKHSSYNIRLFFP